MLEIEKKYRLSESQRREVIETLAELGAVYDGEDAEENTIYGGDALTDGGVIRLRKTQNRALLTFKRRAENQSDAKHQIEYETQVSDADAAERIIEELGLRPKLVYEKRRRTWKLKSVEVVVDELPFGLFMEIEGPLTGIKEAEMLLDIEELEIEHDTYPLLTARMGVSAGDVIEARFS